MNKLNAASLISAVNFIQTATYNTAVCAAWEPLSPRASPSYSTVSLSYVCVGGIGPFFVDDSQMVAVGALPLNV